MNYQDHQDANASPSAEVARISARLVTPLHADVSKQRGNPKQPLLVVTLGEPDGTTDLIAVLPEDAPRLRCMIEAVETEAETWQLEQEQKRSHFFTSRVSRSERLVRLSGTKEYLKKLKVGSPSLGEYVDKQLQSLARSIRGHCVSRRAERSIERRLTMAILIAVDAARWDI